MKKKVLISQTRIVLIYIAVFLLAIAVFSIPLRLVDLELFAPNVSPLVIPTLREWHGGYGFFSLEPGSRLVLDPASANQLQDTVTVLQGDLQAATGRRLSVLTASTSQTGDIFLSLSHADRGLGDEGYVMQVGSMLTIQAETPAGVFYGTRSLLQILQQDFTRSHVPKGTARDYPTYGERGFMLDVGRKFFSLGFLEDYVKFMSWYKMNDFHLHFNDNELNVGDSPDWKHKYAAFRLNSPHFPGLAAKDGSYTEEDMRALERIAQLYHVTITPEIDAPAHALAFTQYRPDLVSPLYAKDMLDLQNPATYTFLNELWSTFLPWFDARQVDIGVDEYDTTDADHYRQFINFYDTFMKQHGRSVRIWGSLSKMQSKVRVNADMVMDVWDNTWSAAPDMVKEGFHIINMNDHLLYIVPKAGYFQDYLDTQLLYEKWEPNIFNFTYTYLNLQPGDPHVLGAMFAEWNDRLGKNISDLEVHERVKPAMQTVSQKLWTASATASNGLAYDQFMQLAGRIGDAPGTNLPSTPSTSTSSTITLPLQP